MTEPWGRQSSVKTGIRWFTIGAIILASAELFARVEDSLSWGAPFWGRYSESLLMMRDRLGVRGRPGYRFGKWHMNRQGFRGDDIAPTPPPGMIRVAVLGASETFGLAESPNQEYPARLRAILDSLAPGRFDVVNVALAGMSPLAMSSYYTRVVAPIRPQIVLVYPSPSFYLESDPLPLDARPMVGADSALPAAVSSGVAGFDLRLAGRGREVLKGLVPPVLLTAVREWQLSRIRLRHPPDWVWDSVPPERMAIFRHHLEAIVTSIQASGAMAVLVTHTNRYIGAPEAVTGEDRHHLVNLMKSYYPRAAAPVLAGVDYPANQVMREVARHAALDLVEAEGQIPAGGRYFADYAHLTDAGADAMARLLATALLKMPRLREP